MWESNDVHFLCRSLLSPKDCLYASSSPSSVKGCVCSYWQNRINQRQQIHQITDPCEWHHTKARCVEHWFIRMCGCEQTQPLVDEGLLLLGLASAVVLCYFTFFVILQPTQSSYFQSRSKTRAWRLGCPRSMSVLQKKKTDLSWMSFIISCIILSHRWFIHQ